ncbi:MAG: hypothetical protein J0L92_25150 [Deltaproteobacteria bacterium]|nr:hypothetical protein [Deltaproteobacteria bacterium]
MREDRELPLIGSRALLLWVSCAVSACGEPPALEERSLRGGDFVCSAQTCTQRELALPDDGDWECMDQSGVVVCRGGHGAAGVHAGPADDTFVCGTIARDEERRRVCVDAQPDLPSAEGWGCRYERDHEGPFANADVRRCTRDGAPRLGARCDAQICPSGLVCREGRCALEREGLPECWLDDDCEGGTTCVLAHCSQPS